jgi:hypothetical protein
MEYWIVYDIETGQVLYPGSGSLGVAQSQVLPQGAALLMVPLAAISGGTINLEPIREGLIGLVNHNCGQFRMQFITDVPGQQASYLTKETEAKAWVPGADLADFPFLAAEAEYTGMTVADIAALVLATAAAWRGLAAKIEGRRRGAMIELAAATDVAALVRGSTVDWPALLASPA